MASGLTGGNGGADSSGRWLSTPRQASKIFSLDGTSGPRQRNQFVVKFTKNGYDSTSAYGTYGTTSGNWTRSLGFMVKSIDRPAMEPKVEELNQYNKKRIVHTGYKIGPTRMVLYDTVDSMAMQMWNEYSQYYFGDFRHWSSRTDFALDTVTPTFANEATGYGFAPQSSTTTALTTTTDLQVPYFFDSISVYQVFGGNFVQFDLMNPKITNFDPDELDYANAEIATISMTVASEAILYVNNFQPQPISSDAFLYEIFYDSGEFNGETVDYANSTDAAPLVSAYNVATQANYQSTGAYVPPYQTGTSTSVPLQTYDNSTGSGSLNAYGQYSFGTTSSADAVNTAALSQDIALQATTNPALASILSLASQAQNSSSTLATQPLVQPYTQPSFISADQYGPALNAVQAIGQSIGNIDTSTAIGQQVTYGLMSAALATGTFPRDQMYNRKPTQIGTNTWNSPDAQGLALTAQAYGIMNAQQPGSVQYGFNTNNITPRPDYSTVPALSPTLSPDLNVIDPSIQPVDASSLQLATGTVQTDPTPTTLLTNVNSMYKQVTPTGTILPLA